MPDAQPLPPDDSYDQWLVLRAQGGEADAMRQLVERWNPRLTRHAMRLTQNAEAANEAAQEAWLGIVRGIYRLDDPACFRRWAYRIVARKCADWIRRRQKDRQTTQELCSDPPAPSRENALQDKQERLRLALQELPSQDRALLAMHYTEAMPLTEIADALGLPLGTVKSRLYHARQRLKAAIEHDQHHRHG